MNLAVQRLKGLRYHLPLKWWSSRTYHNTTALLRESQKWTPDQLAEHQTAELRKMLSHCALNVPYYRGLFRKVGFDPQQLRRTDDLAQLPFLDKDTVLSRTSQLLAENIAESKRCYYTTGGTSGRPLGLYGPIDGGWRELAFMHAQWSRVGFHPDDWRAVLRGATVSSPEHWARDVAQRAFLFSNFHMTPRVSAGYVQAIKCHRPPYFHSYPSALLDFARLLKEQGIEPPLFRAILAGSENIYPGQREAIESFYGCRMFSWYGHSENLVLAGECEQSNYYHVFPEYGVAELIRDDGRPAVEEGEIGTLVGTSLYNAIMPLVRYRTGDYAVVGPKSCSCGRNYRLLRETRGRWRQEMMVGRLGNLISITALNMHTNIFERVRQFQFYQPERGRVQLRLVRKPDYTELDSAAILQALRAKMGDSMEIDLVFLDEIPQTVRGKFRFIVQDLHSLPDASV